MRLQKNKCYNSAVTHSLSKDLQIAINVQTCKALHKEDQNAYFTLAASLTWGMSSSSFRISLNWNKRTLCKSVSIWTKVCKELASDSCHVTQDIQQDKQCMYNITLWCIHITILAVEMQQCIVCVVELHVTVNYINILHNNAFMANLCCWQKWNIHRSSCKVPDVALKQNNVSLFMAFFRCTIWLNWL